MTNKTRNTLFALLVCAFVAAACGGDSACAAPADSQQYSSSAAAAEAANAVSNALMGAMPNLVFGSLSLFIVVGTLCIAKLTSAPVSIEAFFALCAVGVFAFVYVGGVGVVKRVGTFFAPVGKSIALAAILVKKIDWFRAFAPGAILFLHKKASYQSWSVRLLRAYNHRQEAGKTIASLRLTVKNVCPEWS